MTDRIATLPPHPLDGYFARMMATPYLTRRRIMRFKITQRPRRFHYKYRALTLIDPQDKSKGFTARSIGCLRDLIVKSRFYLSPPTEFNDPFDTAACMVVVGTPEQRLARVEQWLNDHEAFEPERRATAMQDLMSRSPEALAELFNPGLERVRRTTGVVCFAGNPRGTLLWSHYAAEHTGVCLQLETARDFPILSRAVTVHYEPEYPTINWLVDYQAGIGKMLLGKHPCWKYEDETRIIVDGEAGTYLLFRPDALRALVFGCRADRAMSHAIASLLAERRTAGLPPVKLYRAHLHGKEYRLVIRRAE
jgi:Protein of unknown function (DUF2971)